MNIIIPLSVISAFALSVALTSWLRQFAMKCGLVDVPNERSSHLVPTPRGGGIAIVIALLIMLPVLGALQILDWRVANGLLAAGTIAAGIGLADDLLQVPLLVRLFFQFVSAFFVLHYVGIESVAQQLPLLAAFKTLLIVLTLLYLVWMLNLTNFMDGIDGIAGIQTVSVCIGTALCLWLAPDVTASSVTSVLDVGAAITQRNGAIAFALILAAATGGFLHWNWSPAHIFLGDSGSGFLGLSLGALTLVAGAAWPPLLWSCTILAGVFIVDATTTLVRRVFRGEVFYHAHCTHAFQHAAKRWGHSRVSLSVLAINVGWLLPWALLVSNGVVNGAVALTLAYIPLFAIVLRLRAGLPQSSRVPSYSAITSIPPESPPRTQGVAQSAPPLP